MKIICFFIAALAGQQCNQPNFPDTGVGGGTATGGSISTGGATATGGNVATGGTLATGGTTGCGSIDTLVSQPTSAKKEAKKPHTVMKRHHRKKGRAKKTTETSSSCPVLHDTNDIIPLDQDEPTPTGSCTGNACVGAISTQMFEGIKYYNEDKARLAYQGGTCEDNGCVVPCTCDSCPAAFCPATNANDTGSLGSSVLKWMTEVGWIKGFTTADTTADLLACLNKGSNPVIGIDWWSGMDNPGKDGEIFANGYVRGGHELRIVGFDGSKFIGINSWGKTWGYCRKSQFPNGCGYFKISPATLVKANFDGDCPVL